MSYAIVWYCDGCGTKMEPSNVEATKKLYAEHSQNGREPQEVFCAVCITEARAFWTSKERFVTELQKEVASRMEKHRHKFWAVNKPKSKETHL